MILKSPELAHELKCIRGRLWIVLNDIDEYFTSHGQTLIITDVMSEADEDARLHRVSKSHSEGRAFDFRTHGLPVNFLRQLEKHFEFKYETWAAIAKESGLPNLIYYHGTGDNHHGHVQIKPYKE